MDWKRMLREISETDQTQAQVAAACEVAQSTISDLARGKIKSPSFELGARLIELAPELIGQPGALALPELEVRDAA